MIYQLSLRKKDVALHWCNDYWQMQEKNVMS